MKHYHYLAFLSATSAIFCEVFIGSAQEFWMNDRIMQNVTIAGPVSCAVFLISGLLAVTLYAIEEVERR